MSVIVGKMRIGEVHTLLRNDYPDIELSKIRYYEDKGRVQPSRSRKGYRLYSERDVECLREAIRLAQEEFVPLRVVRLRLIEQGLLVEDPTKGWGPSGRVTCPGGFDCLIVSIAVDPTMPSTVYVGTSYAGVYKSTDGGQSWKKVTKGLPEGELGRIAVAVADAAAAPADLGELTGKKLRLRPFHPHRLGREHGVAFLTPPILGSFNRER